WERIDLLRELNFSTRGIGKSFDVGSSVVSKLVKEKEKQERLKIEKDPDVYEF
ncbi:19364_t:CDS:1, partial [Racocetra persica]